MLSSPSLSRFVEKTKSENVLCGRLLPVNNNKAFVDSPRVSTATIVQQTHDDGNKIVAFGAFHAYTNNQAYFMVSECAPEFKDKFVTVERYREIEPEPNDEKSRHQCFKIVETFDEDIDYNALSTYHGAFGMRFRQSVQTHVFDRLLGMTQLGDNLDVKKNVTLDLYDPDEFDDKQRTMWRDRTGFVVGDKNRFHEITLKTSDLVALFDRQEDDTSQVIFKQLGPDTEEHIQDYDSTLCILNRQNYLDFLFAIKELKGVVALENNQPVGYALVLADRLIQCYADNAVIARRLAVEACRLVGPSVTMFIKECKGWNFEELLSKATRVRRVQRLHTRISPSQVDMAKVFALNIGVHLF